MQAIQIQGQLWGCTISIGHYPNSPVWILFAANAASVDSVFVHT